MKPITIRRASWTAVLVVVALAASLLWSLSAEKRGDWLHQAASKNNLLRAKLLICLGTDVNSSKGGSTALQAAAYHGNIEMMTFLIQRGAAVDQSGKFEHHSPLGSTSQQSISSRTASDSPRGKSRHESHQSTMSDASNTAPEADSLVV
jgi:hypothetical protein